MTLRIFGLWYRNVKRALDSIAKVGFRFSFFVGIGFAELPDEIPLRCGGAREQLLTNRISKLKRGQAKVGKTPSISHLIRAQGRFIQAPLPKHFKRSLVHPSSSVFNPRTTADTMRSETLL